MNHYFTISSRPVGQERWTIYLGTGGVPPHLESIEEAERERGRLQEKDGTHEYDVTRCQPLSEM